jgi:hypothetical protein
MPGKPPSRPANQAARRREAPSRPRRRVCQREFDGAPKVSLNSPNLLKARWERPESGGIRTQVMRLADRLLAAGAPMGWVSASLEDNDNQGNFFRSRNE